MWDFGDGNSSTLASPSHTYATPGAYTVGLRVTGCNGEVVESVQTAAVVIDPTNIYCSPERFPASDTLTILNCRGVLYDSGGPNARYENNENSQLTITDPNGEPITLTFNLFRTEIFLDRMFIYDGDSPAAPELAVLSGNINVPPIMASGPSVTIVWSSSGNSNDSGWEIVWGNNPSNSSPDATFSATTLTPELNAPVIFSPDVSLPGPLTYDFGDGSPRQFALGPISHAFNNPGTYEVLAIDRSCNAADTARATIVVQEGSTLSISPLAIADTLVVGQTAEHPINLQNLGNRPGLYTLSLPPFAPSVVASLLPFTTANNRSDHQLTGLPLRVPSGRVNIQIEGDYDSADETAEVWIEGQPIGRVGGGSLPLNLNFSYVPDSSQLVQWLADGLLEVSIINSIQVSAVGTTSRHRVSFSYAKLAYASGPAATEAPIPANSSSTYPLTLNSSGMQPGRYRDTLTLNTNGSSLGHVLIPIDLLVVGRPIPALSPTALDFG
ncbi:MAG: PKD domain-containing protein, partial [Lewinella sp.]|nr:PKD domain-containing protein [Lewinella sp.]